MTADVVPYDWKDARLGDYFAIKHGYAFKGEFFSSKGKYILLTPGNFEARGGLKLKGDREKHYQGKVPDEFILRAGDFLIVMTDLTQNAPILGSPALIPENDKYLHNQRLGKIVNLNERELDRRFLYHLLNNERVRAQIRATATGATVRHTAPERIYAVSVMLPPLPLQRKIAAILSAYDDLIENNTRRIAILEEMARSLYREWFVNFRFPSHEQVPMVGVDAGPIPEGWQVKPLREVTTYIGRGISPTYDDQAEGLVINQKCVRDGRLSLEPARWQSKKAPPEKVVRFGDILINSTGIGTLGRVAQVYQEMSNCTVDSHVTIVRPPRATSIDYLGYVLLGLQQHFDRLGAGATGQTELSRERVAETEVNIPPEPLQEQFSDTVSPMRRAAVVYSQKNGVLRRTRDLLLPRLVSGEVDVSSLEIDAAGD